jgi:conjugative transfer signal peptidase TraF
VLACPPEGAAALALERRYLDPGPCPSGTKPLGKLVLAAEGDYLELSVTGIVLNRCGLSSSTSQAQDTQGRLLPHYPAGAYRVRAHEVWLFSPHSRSFDSRYFGPLATANVLGVLHPLFVLPSPLTLRCAFVLRSCAAQP